MEGWIALDSQNLKTFCTVVSEGSMTAAASKLEITQPAVSQQIRQLEKNFGTKLLVRNARKVRPTIQGQILYENSNKVLNIIQQTKHSIQSISLDVKEEKLVVSTLNSLGLYLISPVISHFLKPNKALQLTLFYRKGEDVIKKMQRNEVDVVIVPDLKKEYGKDFPQYRKVHLFKDTMHFVGSGKDMSLPKSLMFKDLKNFRLVKVKDHFPAFNNLFIQKLRSNHINLEPIFECDNVGTVKRVIESSLGCGFLPAHSVRKQLRLGRLVSIAIEDFDYSVDINLYYRADRTNEKLVQILTSLINQQARNTF